MNELRIEKRGGETTTLSGSELEELAGKLKGKLIVPGWDGYDQARAIWNAMIDTRPALIARCANPADVIDVVRFARKRDLRVSVRSAGHNIAGSGLCDGGLVIDLSGMKGVRVDPEGRGVRAQPGANWGDLGRRR